MLSQIVHQSLLCPHADFATEVLPDMPDPCCIDVLLALTPNFSLCHFFSYWLFQTLNGLLARWLTLTGLNFFEYLLDLLLLALSDIVERVKDFDVASAGHPISWPDFLAHSFIDIDDAYIFRVDIVFLVLLHHETWHYPVVGTVLIWHFEHIVQQVVTKFALLSRHHFSLGLNLFFFKFFSSGRSWGTNGLLVGFEIVRICLDKSLCGILASFIFWALSTIQLLCDFG